eukprot:9205-Pyramimonas_sp.AAC.1
MHSLVSTRISAVNGPSCVVSMVLWASFLAFSSCVWRGLLAAGSPSSSRGLPRGGPRAGRAGPCCWLAAATDGGSAAAGPSGIADDRK